MWLPPTPCHLALPAPCGIRGRRGIRLCKWLPPPSPPSCLPVLVISALRRLLPPLQFLCQAKGRTTLTGAPHPHPGAAAGQGAGCSVKDPPPTHPAARASPFFRAAHGWRLGPQRCVCVTAGGRLCDMPGGLCLLPGAIGGGCPLPRSRNSREGRELSSVEPGGGGTALGTLPALRDPPPARAVGRC